MFLVSISTLTYHQSSVYRFSLRLELDPCSRGARSD